MQTPAWQMFSHAALPSKRGSNCIGGMDLYIAIDLGHDLDAGIPASKGVDHVMTGPCTLRAIESKTTVRHVFLPHSKW